jgi:O-antigen ligase
LLNGPPTREDYEGRRTELPADVPPGGVVEVLGLVRGPIRDGPCRLRWDVVQEGVTWFSNVGNAMPEVPVNVLPAIEGAPSLAAAGAAPPTIAPSPPPRSACWRAAVILWRQRPLLGIGPDNFRRSYEAVLSPAPNGQPYTDTRIHANSLYFETLADLGLAGVAALAYLAFALLRLLRKHWAAGALVGLGCAVAAGAFFVHGALDYFFEFTALFGLFWLLLGLTAAHELAPPPS